MRGKTKAEVKDRLDKAHDEINAGIRTPVNYTIEQCVNDWLDTIERDEHTLATWRGQAKKWIYPKIGATKLKDFNATDADRFFKELGKYLSKRTLMMIKSTLRRSIRRAQVHDLIGRNVVELIDLPAGQPGHPSRAMTEAQAAKLLKTASGKATGFVKVVKASKGRYGATHAATETGELACGTKPHENATHHRSEPRAEGNDLPLVPLELGLDDPTTRTSGSKRSSSSRSRSACARANCASSRGIT